jgi:hypothetical protein
MWRVPAQTKEANASLQTKLTAHALRDTLSRNGLPVAAVMRKHPEHAQIKNWASVAFLC